MGTWGAGILQDDSVADVIGFIKDRLKLGESIGDACSSAMSHFSEMLKVADEAPLLWLAIAEVQWKYGQVATEVLARVRQDIDLGAGLERWQEDPKSLSARKAALAKFLAKVETQNTKPSALPKLVVRRAPYQEGDCLSVQVADGQFTAALVLKADNTNPECGKNLVAGLDYCESVPPTLEVFERRDWLVLKHGLWDSEKDIRWYIPVFHAKERARIGVVGRVKLRWRDPKDSKWHTGWNMLGSQILLCRAQ